nr:hypothetical protein [Phaeobacter sp. HF9A]
MHALICTTCGAPLSAQKQRPLAAHKGAKLAEAAARGKPEKKTAARGHAHAYRGKKKKKSKKKSLWYKAFDEVFDVIEDIFD